MNGMAALLEETKKETFFWKRKEIFHNSMSLSLYVSVDGQDYDHRMPTNYISAKTE